MKKLLLFISFVFCFVISQSQTPPITQNIGSTNTLVRTWYIKSTNGLQLPTFTDTTAANADPYASHLPGNQIFTTSDNKVKIRNLSATVWILVSGSAGSGGVDSCTSQDVVCLDILKYWIGGVGKAFDTIQLYDGIVKAGTITQTSTLTFDVTQYLYRLSCELTKTPLDTSVTVSVPDDSLLRIDYIGGNALGQVQIIQGAPSNSATPPFYDINLFLPFTQVFVSADTTYLIPIPPNLDGRYVKIAYPDTITAKKTFRDTLMIGPYPLASDNLIIHAGTAINQFAYAIDTIAMGQVRANFYQYVMGTKGQSTPQYSWFLQSPFATPITANADGRVTLGNQMFFDNESGDSRIIPLQQKGIVLRSQKTTGDQLYIPNGAGALLGGNLLHVASLAPYVSSQTANTVLFSGDNDQKLLEIRPRGILGIGITPTDNLKLDVQGLGQGVRFDTMTTVQRDGMGKVVATVTLTNAGSGYTLGVPIFSATSPTGGQNVVVAATVNTTTGFVTSLTLQYHGNGYSSGGSFTVNNTGTGGTGAAGTFTVATFPILRGTMIFNIDSLCYQSYTGSTWINMREGTGGGGSTPTWQQTLTAGSTRTSDILSLSPLGKSFTLRTTAPSNYRQTEFIDDTTSLTVTHFHSSSDPTAPYETDNNLNVYDDYVSATYSNVTSNKISSLRLDSSVASLNTFFNDGGFKRNYLNVNMDGSFGFNYADESGIRYSFPRSTPSDGDVLTATGSSGNLIWAAGGSGGGVSSVSGTSNRITSTGGTTPVIDISAFYVGQPSITTLGTIGTGTWNATTIGVTKGGTGLTSAATGDLLVATGTNTYSNLGHGTTRQRLGWNGSALAWIDTTASGGAGSTYYNSNIGSGFRLAVPNTNNIKTEFQGYGILIDSSSNSNGLTFKADTATLFSAIRATIPGSSLDTTSFNKDQFSISALTPTRDSLRIVGTPTHYQVAGSDSTVTDGNVIDNLIGKVEVIFGAEESLSLDIPNQIYKIGDVLGTHNGMRLIINDQSGTQTATLGDDGNSGNNSLLTVNDAAATITINAISGTTVTGGELHANNQMNILDGSGNQLMTAIISGGFPLAALGDVDGAFNSTNWFADDNAQTQTFNANNGFSFNTGTVTMSAYGAGAATFLSDGTITSVSDTTQKDHIQEYSTSLSKLDSFDLISYHFRKSSGLESKSTYIGFNAQNVRQVLGENAIGINKKGILSVQDRAVLASAISWEKSMYELIKSQQNEIDLLKKQIKKNIKK